MTKRWIARTLAVSLTGTTACAQIESRSTVTIEPMPQAPAVTLGQAASKVVRRGTDVAWTQSTSSIELRLTQTRQCRAVLHHPVQRVEHVDRTVKHGALYFEYGAAAGLLALGIAALAKPEAFSPQAIDENGESIRDRSVGYRIGGVFTGLGLAMAGVGIYDTVRSRDATYRSQAYAVKLGDTAPCLDPKGPLAAAAVTLTVGSWSATAKSDEDGTVRFELPDEAKMDITLPELPQEATEQTSETDVDPSSESSASEDGTSVPPASESGTPEPPAPEDGAPEPPRAPPPPPTLAVPALVQAAGEEATFELIVPLADPTARERTGTFTLGPPAQRPPKP